MKMSFFGEIMLKNGKLIVTNDSGGFQVEFIENQFVFELTFNRDISKSVVSVTPIYDYAGDDPYLTSHCARVGQNKLRVSVTASNNNKFVGGGFFFIIHVLKFCTME